MNCTREKQYRYTHASGFRYTHKLELMSTLALECRLTQHTTEILPRELSLAFDLHGVHGNILANPIYEENGRIDKLMLRMTDPSALQEHNRRPQKANMDYLAASAAESC